MTLRIQRLWCAWLVLMVCNTVLAGCAVLTSSPPPAGPARAQTFNPNSAPALHIPGPPQAPQNPSLPQVLGDHRPSAPGQAAQAPILQTAAVGQPPSEELAKVEPLQALLALYQKALQRFATMDTYIMRLKRREVVAGSARPEEIMLGKFRKNPPAVYFKWLSEEGKGREVIYVKGKYDNLINTLTADGDIPLLGPGKRFNIAPDSFLVKSKSRYPITEAGLGSLIARFGRLVAAVEKGDPREGAAKYLGLLKRPEFEYKVEGVLQSLPPKSDPLLAKGGQRWWFFDPTNNLPVLLITHDETGREVEYYCHDRFQYPAHLDDDDFNPDKLWKAKK